MYFVVYTFLFLLSVPVLTFKWGHRDNFSLFIELHEAERTLLTEQELNLVNKINLQEYPPN